MKTTTSLLVWVALAVGTAAASAQSPKAESANAKAKVKTVAKSEPKTSTVAATETELTGSRIKRSYRKSGTITDGPSQVAVIDRQTIERSGATDLRELLIHRGLWR